MKKAFFAAGAVAAMIGTLGSGSAFAASGNTAVISGGSAFNICIATNGTYAGSSFAADIVGSGFETQLVYDDFTNEACKNVTLPAGNNTISMRKTSGMDVTSWAIAGNKLTFTASEINDAFLRSAGLNTKRTPASVVDVSFNANGGTGSMASVSGVPNVTITLPTNTLTREDYLFNGWNTKADGTGVSYADGATISSDHGGIIELFAQWKEDFATLMVGSNFNIALKSMVNNTSVPSVITEDRSIESVEFVTELPNGVVPVSQANVAVSGSLPIYAYYDGNHHVYISSPAKKIYANDDAGFMFSYMRALSSVTFTGPDHFSTSRTSSMRMMFGDNGMHQSSSEDNSLTTIAGLEYFDTSSVSDMVYMFGHQYLSSVSAMTTTQRDGYVSWDVSNVSSMDGLFRGSVNLNDISALSSWDISKLEGIRGMFAKCSSLSDISALSNWDTKKIKRMEVLFMGASSLSNISPLAKWNISGISSLQGVFQQANLTNLEPLRTTQRDGYKSWDVSNINDMSALFSYNYLLSDIGPLSSWDVSSVKKFGTDVGGFAIGGMFEAAKSLTDLTPISDWDVSNAENMNSMFGIQPTVNFGYMSLSDLTPISKWNTSNLKNAAGMFRSTAVTDLGAIATTQRDGYKSWDISNVTAMQGMFAEMRYLTNISALSSWNVENVKNMGSMFYKDSALSNISALSGWDVKNVDSFATMFFDNYSISDLSPLDDWAVKSTASIRNAFDGVPVSVQRPSWYNE